MNINLLESPHEVVGLPGERGGRGTITISPDNQKAISRELDIAKETFDEAFSTFVVPAVKLAVDASIVVGGIGDLLSRPLRARKTGALTLGVLVATQVFCGLFPGRSGYVAPTEAKQRDPVTEVVPPPTATNESVSPTSTPQSLSTEEPFVQIGYGGELTKEQNAFNDSERGKELALAYDQYVTYWKRVGLWDKDANYSLIPLMDREDPTNPAKAIYVGVVNNDKSFEGFVFTPPIKQVTRYLATGDIDALTPPEGNKLQPLTDPFQLVRQVDVESEESVAGGVIPDGAILQFVNGEFVYMSGTSLAKMEVVGKLDENFQYVRVIGDDLIQDTEGQVFIYVDGEKIAIAADRMDGDVPLDFEWNPAANDGAGAWVKKANETVAGGLKLEIGEPDENGNALIEKFIAPDDMVAEDLERWEAQWDETRLGLEGDWVQTQDGRVVLLDDLSDPESVLAEYKIFEQTGTMQVVVDADKLEVDNENVILSMAELEEWRDGLPVDYERVQALNLEMAKEGVGPVYKSLRLGVGAQGLAGYILSIDGKTGVSIRYIVPLMNGVTDEATARSSTSGIVFFRNSDGGYTYFFVENFELEYID